MSDVVAVSWLHVELPFVVTRQVKIFARASIGFMFHAVASRMPSEHMEFEHEC